MNDTPVSGDGSPPEPNSSRGGFTADIAAGGGRLSLELLQITGMVPELASYASRSDALADCSGGGPDPLPAPRTC